MPIPPYASWMLEQEARALMTRLARVKPFALQESMLPAAGLLPSAQLAIEKFLMTGRKHLRVVIRRYLDWLHSPAARWSDAQEAQRRFTILRLRFNTVVTQFDMFENVITQRSESETGVWLSGLDVVSSDALAMRGYFESPAVICYLQRGVGAAIRRARTRMPGGGNNPVAIVQVPRERMIGSGIGSSLVHEVGHQAAALLDLVDSIRPVLEQIRARNPHSALAWGLWKRWISEIVADFWSIARVGVASTMGLIGVLSLPRVFVFRVNPNDPHPAPWIRVKLSAAIGSALYPQQAWGDLSRLWDEYYPMTELQPAQREIFEMLEATMPELVQLLIHHRPSSLRGKSLSEALEVQNRQPRTLRAMLRSWRWEPKAMYDHPSPTMVLAAIGQGRADGRISPEEESAIIGKLLTHWALKVTLQAAENCTDPAKRECVCQGAA